MVLDYGANSGRVVPSRIKAVIIMNDAGRNNASVATTGREFRLTGWW